jgi:predicted nucleotidyltransferase
MQTQGIQPPSNYQAVIDRFVAACRADERVVAAFLGGSYAAGNADAHSDLDLCLITTDDAYNGFLADRGAFIRLLGEPVFLESFNRADVVFFILADGAECELAAGRESDFRGIHGGPYRTLLDTKGILDGAVFPWHTVDHAEQTETLRRLVTWFWHDLSHFITAMARGQLWWANGQLEVLRRVCVNLARLREDFSAAADDYDKVEKAVPATRLSPLEETFCPLEHDAMLRAGFIILRFFQELASPLARAHDIPWPATLERVMVGRLEQLGSPE